MNDWKPELQGYCSASGAASTSCSTATSEVLVSRTSCQAKPLAVPGAVSMSERPSPQKDENIAASHAPELQVAVFAASSVASPGVQRRCQVVLTGDPKRVCLRAKKVWERRIFIALLLALGPTVTGLPSLQRYRLYSSLLPALVDACADRATRQSPITHVGCDAMQRATM